MMLKTCIIGISGYGAIHYDLLMKAQAEGKISVVGAAIINQDEEEEKCSVLREKGCEIFDDYNVMLQELSGKAEFCMIPTGTPLHRPMTVAALEAGMNVLVEKPAAGCIEDVNAMRRAQAETGFMVAVGYQQMYASSTLETKRHILNGTIGKIESIKSLVMWPRNHEYYERNGWAGKLNVGGTKVNDSPYNNAVAHELMMMLFQAGKSEKEAAMPISVEAGLYRANDIESPDTACMEIETEEGISIRFYATHASREHFNPEIYIKGTEGNIVMTHNGSVITPHSGKVIKFNTKGNSEARDSMIASVIETVKGANSFICDIEMASRQSIVVSMIHDSQKVKKLSRSTVISKEGKASTFIPGIENVMRKAFEKECLFQDIGFQ